MNKKIIFFFAISIIVLIVILFFVINQNSFPDLDKSGLQCDTSLISLGGDANLIVRANTIGDHRGDLNGWSVQKVEIVDTLDGINVTGDIFSVGAKNMYWESNKEYLLYLENHGIGEDGDTTLIEAKDPNTEIKKELNKCNKAILWMVHEDGWGRGILKEFVLLDNMQYEYVRRTDTGEHSPSKFEVYKGIMNKETIQTLLERVFIAGEGPDGRDAGIVVFTWRDGSGKIISKQYNLASSLPSSELMNFIEEKSLEFKQFKKEVLKKVEEEN